MPLADIADARNSPTSRTEALRLDGCALCGIVAALAGDLVAAIGKRGDRRGGARHVQQCNQGAQSFHAVGLRQNTVAPQECQKAATSRFAPLAGSSDAENVAGRFR